MKTFSLAFAIAILFSPVFIFGYPAPPDPKLDLLKAHVLVDILSAPVKVSMVEQLMASMQQNGSWPDINYADKTRGWWTVNDHLTRLLDMALAWKQQGELQGNAELKKKLLSGLDFWLDNDFICPNWWYPQIGVPKVLAPVMLLMENQLTAKEMADGLKILARAKIGMTGQNKVWLSGNVIYRSLLDGNETSIEQAVAAIQQEIVVSLGEGIQPDYSFHQHGTQQQFGNYGSAFAADMLKWGMIFRHTAFEFDAGSMAILRNYLLEGVRWITWKNKMDISACGRQLVPHAQAEKALGIARIMATMPLVDSSNTDRYKAAMKDFSGDKHFWNSDMTVHRRDSFYMSVKMSSNRVGGSESCNEENIQGYHLGDGATYFYQSGNEYTDIFPLWDWKMIPGTTAFHGKAPLPVLPCSGYNIHTDFAGGVSDGMNGIATLAYGRDSLSAQKSWFFFDDAAICLGAGIHSSLDTEVRTTINQVFFNTPVIVRQSGGTKTLNAVEHSLAGTSWVIEDGWGYYFPGKADVELANQEQSGSWHSVLTRMPRDTVKGNVFTLWLNHGKSPVDARYAYFVFAGAKESTMEKRAEAIAVIVNNAGQQAVENPGKAGLVFIKPGTVQTSQFGAVAASDPCVMLITRKLSAEKIFVSDPTHKLAGLSIGLKGKRGCRAATVLYDAGKDISWLTVVLPRNEEAGKTLELWVE